ncbi:helix-turn-helix domain-containing protein [Streptomyces roseifaciens]|uniref:helix-turn-helix domain-containing protein n=1 Tax=Streptomyces roseifaciens TaxID=1488406 RepID=UPI0013661908|nr:helix-turn-helix domain-containing protein [Streptomyces roseifaciens]
MNSSHDGQWRAQARPRVRGSCPAHGEPLLDRAFRVLGCCGPDTPVLSLTALTVRADLPKATALRIARKFTEQGALERTDSGHCTIGLRVLEIAAMAPRGHGLRTIAMPCLQVCKSASLQVCKTSGTPPSSMCNWSCVRAWSASLSSGSPRPMAGA